MSVRRRRFDRLIPAYLEGALSDRKRRWFENRLRDSEPCRAEVATYQRMREEVRKVTVDYPDSYAWQGFTSTLRQRIEQDARLSSPARSRRPRGFEVAAGAVGGAVCGTVCAFAVVYFGLSSGLVPTGRRALDAPSLAALTAQNGLAFPSRVIESRGDGYLVEFVTPDGATRMAVQMNAAQLVALLRPAASSVDLEDSDAWEATQMYDSRQGPIDLYGDGDGDAGVYLVSSR